MMPSLNTVHTKSFKRLKVRLAHGYHIVMCSKRVRSHWLHHITQQAATLLAARGCIAAATYWIRLRISTTAWIFPILYNGLGYVPQSWPFHCEDLGPKLIHGSLGSPKSISKWHLDQFIRFGTTHCSDQQTHMQTISNNRPHLSQ